MQRLIILNRLLKHTSITAFAAALLAAHSSILHAQEALEGDVLMNGNVRSTQLGEERGININGLIQLMSGEGYAQVSFYVENLPPNRTFPAHIHNLSCAEGGGSHYVNDQSVNGAIESNELWPTLYANANGLAQGSDYKPFKIRSDARSVIIHDQDGGRIACGDLVRQ